MMVTFDPEVSTDTVTTSDQDAVLATGSSFTQFEKWIKISVITLVSLSVIISNIFNTLGWARVQHIAMATRIYLINLSISDLLVGLVACAPSIYPAVQGTWPYGATWCQVSGVMHGSSVTVSIWSISLVSLDRFCAVTWPLTYVTKVTKYRCAGVLLGLWTCALTTFVAPCFTKSDFIYYQYDDRYKMCGLYWEYRMYCVVTGLYIPILCGGILLFTSAKIAKALKTSRKFREGSLGNSHKSVNSMNRKALKVVIATSVVYFLFWGPYVTLVVVQALVPSWVDLTPDWLSFSVLWLANSNSSINVLVYSLTNYAFRAHLLAAVVPCLKTGEVKEHSTMSNPDTPEGPIRGISQISLRVTQSAPGGGAHWEDTGDTGVV